MRRIVVDDQVEVTPGRGFTIDLVEEADEFLMPVARHALAVESDPDGAGEVHLPRCEAITQPPAPFHPIVRGRPGASLLAMILYSKLGEHQPLNRQSASYAREGIELDTSTLADWVGACAATLMPLVELIRHHVLTAERLRRRHDRAGAGKEQDRDWSIMDLRPR